MVHAMTTTMMMMMSKHSRALFSSSMALITKLLTARLPHHYIRTQIGEGLSTQVKIEDILFSLTQTWNYDLIVTQIDGWMNAKGIAWVGESKAGYIIASSFNSSARWRILQSSLTAFWLHTLSWMPLHVRFYACSLCIHNTHGSINPIT